ncbi:hypothetical protein GOP47_0007277 [Adiantum capillus-veneris]|uniref:RING-CH-type domain-containing protein n=1 Tax=Adiantum capillus-veneris TaxID=13818 RepID=A0A9D4ZJ27_ADICA|nr:hypothetical protein GOP47_0007277 [Adiantum capillus-veneris]
MTEGLGSEAEEGVGNTSTISDATIKLQVNKGADPEIYANKSHVHTSEVALLQVRCVHVDEEVSLDVCRICQCHDSDEVGENALKLLRITVPSHAIDESSKAFGKTGLACHVDRLMELGCACKNDHALAHYACALRWFVSRASVVCEICGMPAANVNIIDWINVLCVLRGKDALQQTHVIPMLANVDISPCRIAHCTFDTFANASEDLIEVMAWFDPAGNRTNLPRTLSEQTLSEQVIDVQDDVSSSTSPATKWAIEVAGILIATGLLTVTITWLLSSRLDKSVARRGVDVLLGGLCALSIVVFLRFGVLPRIKYGPARYWAILVVFWFLVFGVWASTTRSSRSHS